MSVCQLRTDGQATSSPVGVGLQDSYGPPSMIHPASPDSPSPWAANGPTYYVSRNNKPPFTCLQAGPATPPVAYYPAALSDVSPRSPSVFGSLRFASPLTCGLVLVRVSLLAARAPKDLSLRQGILCRHPGVGTAKGILVAYCSLSARGPAIQPGPIQHSVVGRDAALRPVMRCPCRGRL